jgi:hypothetical protein
MQLTGVLTWPELRVFYDESRCAIVLQFDTEELNVPLEDAYVLQGQLARAVRKCEHDS